MKQDISLLSSDQFQFDIRIFDKCQSQAVTICRVFSRLILAACSRRLFSPRNLLPYDLMISIFNRQIDRVLFGIGVVFAIHEKTLAVKQVCGGLTSFNVVEPLCVFRRWICIVTISNQMPEQILNQASLVTPCFEFDENERMKPSSHHNHLVDVIKQCMKFRLIFRNIKDHWVSSYSACAESVVQFSRRVN